MSSSNSFLLRSLVGVLEAQKHMSPSVVRGKEIIKKAVRTPPICKKPVGLGGNRVITFCAIGCSVSNYSSWESAMARIALAMVLAASARAKARAALLMRVL